MKIRVTITGRSYHLAAELPREIELADGAGLTAAIAAINELLPDDAGLPASCIIAVNGEQVGTIAAHQDTPLSENSDLFFVAPVAGG